MTRKCAWAGASLWCALALSAAFGSSNDLVFFIAAFGIALLSFFTFEKHRHYTIVCFVFFSMGIASNALYTHFVYDRLTALDGQEIAAKGYITEISQINGSYDRVTVRTRIGGVKTELSYVIEAGDYRYYDEIAVSGKVSRIKDTLKFEGESYYYTQGVFLHGPYNAEYTLTGRNVNIFMRAIKEYRDKMFVLINQLAPNRNGAFLSAMLCGDKSEMSPSMKAAMYRSGLGHIFAVSGVHLVIVTGLFGFIAKRLIQIRKLETALLLVQIWGFALFAGLSVSVVRAAIMLTLSQTSYLFGRKSDTPNSLGLCIILLCLFKPYSALSPSLVLSFLAVLGLYSAQNMLRRLEREKESSAYLQGVRGLSVSSLGVLFCTAPASAVIFGGISPVTLISNILLVPLCVFSLELCFVVMLTGGVFFISGPLILLAEQPIKLVLWAAYGLASLPFGFLAVNGSLMILIVSLGSAAAVLCILVKGWNRYFLPLGLSVIVLWSGCSDLFTLMDTAFTVSIFADSKGTEYVIGRRGRAVVFDIGCNGSMNSTLQRFTNLRGFAGIDVFFIFDKSESAAWLADDIFLQPEYIFVREEPLYFHNSEVTDKTLVFDKASAEINGLTVTVTDEGYEVRAEDDVFLLCKGKFVSNGEVYTLEKGYAYETDTDSENLRRMDYGFERNNSYW